MDIQGKNFIATPSDIEKLAGTIMDSELAASGGRGTYLKALIGTVQHELGSPTRQRNVRAERLDKETIQAHLKAFQAVFERFHETVVRVAEAIVPAPDAELLRSRTGFSRSAGSTVRGFIRAGNDIRSLAAHKATKAALATPRGRRRITVESMKRSATRLAGMLQAVARNLHAANRETAAEVLGPILAELAKASGALEHATKDVEKATEERLPLQTSTGVFVPIDFATARRRAA